MLSPMQVVPEATINGVLMYVGYEGIVSTTLYERTLLLVTPTKVSQPVG